MEKGLRRSARFKKTRVLRQLDLRGVGSYPVAEKDFKDGVWALIDAEPAALSRRMQLLQAAMPTATKLALSVQPSARTEAAACECGGRRALVCAARCGLVSHRSSAAGCDKSRSG